VETPIRITYRELDASESLSRLIETEAGKLERYFDRIVGCHVLVEREQQHLRSGAPFRVRIDLRVPGEEIAIDAAPSARERSTDDQPALRRKRTEISAMYKDPALAVRDAFRRARRRLQEHARRCLGPHVRSSVR